MPSLYSWEVRPPGQSFLRPHSHWDETAAPGIGTPILFPQQAPVTELAELPLVERVGFSGDPDLEFIIGLSLKALSFPHPLS